MPMRTPFYEIHKSLNAKIVDFHGWEMPLQYSGIIDEHANVRKNVGLFDVSHMGRFKIKGPNAYDAIQNLVTNDISKLNDGHGLYSPMCYESGGIVDDVIVYRINKEDFLLVVNASNREKDFQWVIQHSQSSKIENVSDEIALLAIQGPLARNAMQEISESNLELLRPFDLISGDIFQTDCMISRTGYTGEDGFEIFFDSSRVEIWNKIMQSASRFNIKPSGLGCRDTLRLEAGLMLYGNDMDENTTPLEVPLKWTVKLEKEFIGKMALLNGKVNRKLVGFEVLERRIARHGNEVLVDGSKAGFVTSGSFSPTLKKSIGFCFVPLQVELNQLIEIDIEGKLYKARVCSTRFYKRN
ncbi:MAG: glycine cleavage system aminomethyltransferase GcvT [Nitrosopumilales archaeon]|nr:MAG: glycine cleavage system aminomethyltransferase GcvT [Nitrosopumilales archaeon]